MTREASRALGFEPAISFDGPVDTMVSDETARSAVATVREALSNVARHARATEVAVAVAVVHQTLIVRVVDNGIGAGPDANHSGGHGLRNMRERAERRGGRFQLQSGAENRDSVLEWILPPLA